MRHTRIQPKDHRLVPIPDDLRDAMREVHQLLQDAENDPDIAVDYDDAIQVNGLCGGRYHKGTRPFGFTYYPINRDSLSRCITLLHLRSYRHDICRSASHVLRLSLHYGPVKDTFELVFYRTIVSKTPENIGVTRLVLKPCNNHS